ncbi:hypothetical protein OS175_13600 [Marinicella sp. S1101]|nr:hypothetical protein [Marinicella marina]
MDAETAQPFELNGFQAMINQINGVVYTEKTHFKTRNKDGSPKYLHQLADDVYEMTVSSPGEYSLTLKPETWFKITQVDGNAFQVKIVNLIDMWEQHKTDEFNITWQVDKNVYCDDCKVTRIKTRDGNQPGLMRQTQPFELLGFAVMMKQLYGVEAVEDTAKNERKANGAPMYLHQIEDEVYTLKVSEPGNYDLILTPEEWFEINQLKGDVFEVKIINPSKIRSEEHDESFTVDWRLETVD